MILNKLLYRISLNKARSWIMVFNCNMNAFSRFTTIINLYIENMSLEMTIKKLGSVYKFRVGRATGNEHIFFVWPYCKTFACRAFLFMVIYIFVY